MHGSGAHDCPSGAGDPERRHSRQTPAVRSRDFPCPTRFPSPCSPAISAPERRRCSTASSRRSTGKRYAVIVNEFGEIGIDNDLVVGADEEVFEMNNGCICCTVRGDLIRILDGLMKRRGQVRRDHRRDPPALPIRLPSPRPSFVDQDVSDAARLDAVVTVADAKWLTERLKDAPEAKNQDRLRGCDPAQQDRPREAGRSRRGGGPHQGHQPLCPPAPHPELRFAPRRGFGAERLRPRPHHRGRARFS